ncbi:albumin-2-like [Spinacia oleracea]|uniref:Albumin-2-like n=1 Tax=Spinacia oleracea TaxID=3562 RepID=A0ABM3QY72_SPIOL|nr:albumin-2-like [Spinacia oleracea]
MFPFLKGSEFENGIFAAFNSTIPYVAYLFSWGDQYARINYSDNGHYSGTNNISILFCLTCTITQGFPCLKGTIFEKGIDACFASHIPNQVYLFKHDSYAFIYTLYPEYDRG